LIPAAAILVLAVSVSGEITRTGTTAANFLLLEPGAAAVSLGGAAVARSGDASVLWWNPAAASHLGAACASVSTTRLYLGVDHHFSAVIAPLGDNSAFGFSSNFVTVGDMEVTTLTEPDGTGESFDADNLALGLSFARRLTNRVHIGLSWKLLQERIWLEKARGWAVDLGTFYHVDEAGIAIGMTLSNFGPRMRMEGPHLSYYDDPPADYPGAPDRQVSLIMGEYSLPAAFRMGLSWRIMGAGGALLPDPLHGLTAFGAVRDRFDSPIRSNWGLEYTWNRAVALRGGFRGNHDTAGISLGCGFLVPLLDRLLLRCDYAWTDYGDLGGVQTWTLTVRGAEEEVTQ